MQATDGKLYGMTTNGGSSDVGVIFSFDPSSVIFGDFFSDPFLPLLVTLHFG